jgi:putative ABC transport system permease protein
VIGGFLLTQGSQWRGAYIYGLGFAAVSLGVYITFRILQFPDLTIQGSFAVGGSICAALINNQAGNFLGNPWVATLLGMVGGGLAGAATGFLNTRFKINGLLAGILVSAALFSIDLRIMGQSYLTISSASKPITLLDQLTTTLSGKQNVVGLNGVDPVVGDFIRMGFFALVAVLLVVGLNWFWNTQIGLALRATGDNENMIRALGVNTDNAKVLVLTLSNGLIGLAGAFLAQYQGQADVSMGADLIVVGLAAVILGEAFMSSGSIFLALCGALVGSVLYRLIASSVFSLELTLSVVLRASITGLLIALISYVVFLTLNPQTPSWLSLTCVALGSIVGVSLSSFLYYLGVYFTQIDENTEILKLEVGDVKLELAVLVIIAMAVPFVRQRLGLNKLKAAISK